MRRCTGEARSGWQATVEAQGFPFHSGGTRPEDANGGTYWDETVHYEFSADEIDAVEAAANELHSLCLQAVERVARTPSLMSALGIPMAFHRMIARAVEERHPSVYGRFDLAYVEGEPAKMLEYNADTPTTLIESALVQWHWLQDRFPDADQFNSLHERLIERWRELAGPVAGRRMHFSATATSMEEFATTEYLRDTASQAGIDTAFLAMSDVGWNGRAYTDLDEKAIDFWFKLYPWEWMCAEPFAEHLPDARIGFVEPAWKMILSNKGILPILWEMFPDHPNLLPAYRERPRDGGEWVGKPLLSREGANVSWLGTDGLVRHRTEGPYGGSPTVWQRAAELSRMGGFHSVLGVWMVDDAACGMIVREDESPIIVDRSAVVPHLFR